ncbi:MAG: DUF1592 domain-containing protein [bacterium]
MRDLTGETSRPGRQVLPDDDIGYGFDNIGDVLTTSALHVEGWEGAGRLALENSLTAPIEPTVTTFEAEQLFSDVGAANGDVWVLWSNGELPADVELPADGEYIFRVGAFGAQAGPAVVRMALLLDGQELATVDVPETRANPGTYTHRFSTTAGPHTLAVAFLNDYYMPDDPDPAQRDRNLLVDYLELEGPYGVAAADPARRAALMICEPAGPDDSECARLVISDFARRAWRRPVELSEVNRLMGLVDLALAEGDGVDQGILLALQAVLLSPHFIFKVEVDADPTSTTPHPLAPHELATRLSYFLWGSTPDAALLAAADAGRLTGQDLADQVTRMLADPRAIALVEGFADQWLYTGPWPSWIPTTISSPTSTIGCAPGWPPRRASSSATPSSTTGPSRPCWTPITPSSMSAWRPITAWRSATPPRWPTPRASTRWTWPAPSGWAC